MPSDRSTAPDAVRFVVPLRSFTDAKARLRERLDAEQRAELVRQMAENVVKAAQPHSVTIVSAAPEVVAWAQDHGHDVCNDPGGLDDAVEAGIADSVRRGADRIVVAHGDLPLAQSFESVLAVPTSQVVLVADRHGDGTPVVALPADCSFRPRYGPGSFEQNSVAVTAAGFSLTVVADATLAFDLDVPGDLDDMNRLAQR